VPDALVDLAHRANYVVVLEDGIREGGIGSAVTDLLRDAGCGTPVRVFGVPRTFLEHGKRTQILEAIGLTDQQVSRAIIEWVAAQPGRLDASSHLTQERTRSQVPGTSAP
jgi:1-deoxy-D-xylulose-5-phosphate synthase